MSNQMGSMPQFNAEQLTRMMNQMSMGGMGVSGAQSQLSNMMQLQANNFQGYQQPMQFQNQVLMPGNAN